MASNRINLTAEQLTTIARVVQQSAERAERLRRSRDVLVSASITHDLDDIRVRYDWGNGCFTTVLYNAHGTVVG